MTATILSTILCVLLMKFGASIQMVKLISSLIFALRPLILMFLVRKNYKIDDNVVLEGEPIKQKWNGFSQHLASVVNGNIDMITLSLFSTMANVSIYSVYQMITRGVNNIVMTAATGLESMF